MKVPDEEFIAIANKLRAQHQLKSIVWESTLRCTMNCLHCGSDCKKSGDSNDMPAKDFFRFMLEIKRMQKGNPTFVTLSGGEPLLREDVADIGQFLTSNRITWGIVTNGTLLDERVMNKLESAGINSMSISLDGLKASHEWMRGVPGCFEKTMAAIKLMIKAKLNIYDVITCVTGKSVGDLEELYQLFVQMGLKRWRLTMVFPKGRAKSTPELFLNESQFTQLMNFIERKRSENKIIINYSCDGFLGQYEQNVRGLRFFCRAGINTMGVRVDGSISGCLSMREGFDQGNVYSDNIEEIWNNKFAEYRDRSWAKKGVCADCKSFDLCLGNSLHLRESFSDDSVLCYCYQYNLQH